MVDNLVEENEELDVALGKLANNESGWMVESNGKDFDFDRNLREYTVPVYDRVTLCPLVVPLIEFVLSSLFLCE